MPTITDVYEVQPGDSLSKIAVKFGLSLDALLAANQQILNPNLIKIGQKINIPGTAPTPAPEPAPGHTETYDGIHPAPGTVSMARTNYNHPPLTNEPGHRDPATYSQLINQFAVGNNPRYLPDNGNTYCNIFAWDVSRAMGAEIPHWVDSAGHIMSPDAPNATEININGGINWMRSLGVTQFGFHAASPQQAQDAANQGKLAVVMWKNTGSGHGHVAVVRPGTITDKGPAIAQAGRHNFNSGHVSQGFGELGPLEYYWHD
jgi:LysM repeat protein